MTFEQVVARFDGAKGRGNGSAAYMAPCPAHPDDTRSLSLGCSDDGRKTLLKCFAGCSVERIVAAVGMKMADLFDGPRTTTKGGGRGAYSPPRNTATVQHDPVGCTLAAYAAAKRLPLEQLRTFGLSEITYQQRPAVRMPYRDVDGREHAVRFRLSLEAPHQRFAWKSGSKLGLYGLDRLAEARAVKQAALVEGESDAQTLWCRGLPALGLPGAGTYKDNWATHFDGLETIYVVIEPDDGGANLLKTLAHSRLRDRVRLVRFDGYKDVSAVHVADPEAFPQRWSAALEAAEPWADYEARARDETTSTAWAQCHALARESDILGKLDQSLQGRGLVGERTAARLVYLQTTSRLQPRPVSSAVKGPSSGGKSHVVQQVLEHFPPEAYYSLSAMSERALAYSEEPLAHRMLVLYEAAGMSGDFASYLIRSLLSEGRVRYETVEKTKDGMRPRLIEREGPTGLITTTTAVALHPENETRLLSIPVTDTPDQTRQVLEALSIDHADDSDEALVPWRALQTWLTSAERRVVIPYATALAEKIPPVAIRLRRDFTTLLTLIRSHAMLHQATRRRDDAGRIVATIVDYQAVRELVLDLFNIAVQATVSKEVRETVAAVVALNSPSREPVSLGAVAKRLTLDKSTVSRRVKVAMADGYLQNLETRKGQAMKLVSGEPLPEAQPLLPDPAGLEAWCSVAPLQEGIGAPPPPPQDGDGDEGDVF